MLTARIAVLAMIAQTVAYTAGYGAAYYVATDGDDAAPGTFDQPWATIQQAADRINPGDVVYIRGGIYRQMFDINRSGTEDNWIVFQNYDDEDVRIWWSKDMSDESDWIHQGGNIWYTADGSFSRSVNYDVATIWHDDESHWSYKKDSAGALAKQWDFYHNVDAGRLEVYSTANPALLADRIEVPRSPPASPYQFVTWITGSYIIMDGLNYRYMNVHGIKVKQGVHHFVFRNGSISHGGGGNISPSYSPRVRWGDCVDVTGSVHHVWFENSVFGEYPDGTLTNQGKAGEQHYLYFRNNYIYKSTCGIHCWLGDVGAANPGTSLLHVYYEGNTFEDIGLGWFEDKAVMAGGIQIIPRENVGTDHVYIRDNLFIRCGTTTQTGDTWRGVNCPINIGGGNITVADNIMYGGPSEGIHIRSCHQRYTGSMFNNLIYNCGWSGIRLHQNGYSDAVKVYNNTIVNCGDGSHANVQVMGGANATFRSNIFYSTVSQELSQAAGDFDHNCFGVQNPIGSHSIKADPVFGDLARGDFHLDAQSPCIDNGTGKPAPDVDLDAIPRPYGGGMDIGAYEYSGAEAAITLAPVAETSGNRLAVKVVPNPAPAGSRIKLQVSGYPEGSVPVMRIYDGRGRMVRRMNIVTAPGAVNIWDGADAYCRPVADGTCIVEVKLGGSVARSSVTITSR